jgi:hypothetical protein
MMRFRQARVLRIVAIQAKSRSILGEMELILPLIGLADLMSCMARVAAHVQSGVAAAFLRNVQTLRMTLEAQVLIFIPGGDLQQLILVGRTVRIVTCKAIPGGWSVRL